jgi:hypothetical protein
MTTFYPYAAVDGTALLAYTGTPVNATTQPADSSLYPPPSVTHTVPSGYTDYFDGVGWIVGPTVSNLSAELCKTVAAARATTTFSNTVSAAASGYSEAEQSTWSMQLAQAQEVLTGGTSTLLATIAAAKGLTVQDLAQKIVTKSTAYNTALANALAAYHTAQSGTATVASITLADLVASKLTLRIVGSALTK